MKCEWGLQYSNKDYYQTGGYCTRKAVEQIEGKFYCGKHSKLVKRHIEKVLKE